MAICGRGNDIFICHIARAYEMYIKALTILFIEMQVISQPYWKERSLTYLCKLFNQLDAGENNENAIKTIHIGILDFERFPGE